MKFNRRLPSTKSEALAEELIKQLRSESEDWQLDLLSLVITLTVVGAGSSRAARAQRDDFLACAAELYDLVLADTDRPAHATIMQEAGEALKSMHSLLQNSAEDAPIIIPISLNTSASEIANAVRAAGADAEKLPLYALDGVKVEKITLNGIDVTPVGDALTLEQAIQMGLNFAASEKESELTDCGPPSGAASPDCPCLFCKAERARNAKRS